MRCGVPRLKTAHDRDWAWRARDGGNASGRLPQGTDALAALVGAEYGGDPFSGVIYVFRAKRSDRVKLVWWDGTGLCLMAN